jgi:hypothetical protein
MTDSLKTVTADKYVIHLGQTFSTYDDYLQLFGITPDDRPWAQPLPGHPEICIWGPEFHNAHWHNDGNPDSLMPTITEYWHVEGADPDTVRLRNIDHYTYLRYRKELRVTFMKGLRDSTFTFLGLYSMDHQLSDTNRIVWQRVAEECDLTHLDYLEQFLVYAFIWAYSMRAQYTNVGLQVAQNYIISESEDIVNSFNIYKVISDSDSPGMLLSKMADMIKPISTSRIRADITNIHQTEDHVYQNYLHYFYIHGFLEDN